MTGPLTVAIDAATILALLAAAWWPLRRRGDGTGPTPLDRFASFAILDIAVVFLVTFLVPGLLVPTAVLTGMIGGFYLGRAWEQAKLARLLDAPPRKGS